MIFEYKEPDIDLLIKCLIENGCTVTKAKDGEGGIFVNGRRLSDNELEECLFNPKPPTNADRIRAMSDEELADFLISHGSCTGLENESKCLVTDAPFCDRCWLDWLKEEAT